MKKQNFKIGSSIKVIRRSGHEEFRTVEISGGDILLYTKSGSYTRRKLHTSGSKQFFNYAGIRFERRAV